MKKPAAKTKPKPRSKPAAKPARVANTRPESSHEWYTPRFIIEALTRAAGRPFDLDVCSPRSKHWTAKRCLTIREDGLKTKWPARSFLWCNPPYDDPLPWATKMLAHSIAGGNGVMLVNESASVFWWRAMTTTADAILLLGDRVRFVDIHERESGSNNRTSALIGFGPLGFRAVAGAYVLDDRLDGTFCRPLHRDAVRQAFFAPGDPVFDRAPGVRADDPRTAPYDRNPPNDPTDRFFKDPSSLKPRRRR